MRSGAEQVVDGVHLVNETEETLRQINQEMGKTTEMVGEISHASNEQQAVMTELAQNVAVIDQTSTTVDYPNAVVTRMRKAVMQYGV